MLSGLALGAVVAVLAAGCGGGGTTATLGGTTAGENAPASDTSAETVRPGFSAQISIGHPDGHVGLVVDEEGRTVYVFGKDEQGSGATACYGACAKVWAPVLTDAAPRPYPYPGMRVDTAKLGTIQRTDGTTQVTYAGYPLYRFAAEPTARVGHAGQESFGAEWNPITPEGEKVAADEVEAN